MGAKKTFDNKTKKTTAKKQGETHTLSFVFEKETPGTFRYQEDIDADDTPLVGTLYLKKTQMPAKAPETITVTIAF